jgi:hypothetical protein
MKGAIRMKTIVNKIYPSFILLVLLSGALQAQNIFSRFDFDDVPLTIASIGPNGVGIDADGTSDGMAAYITGNCGGLKGIDLEIPNAGALFDVPSIGMAFNFKRFESRADFFVRGGTQFYVNGGSLYIAFRTSDGSGGFIDYGPFNTGYVLPSDATFHEYMFIYTAALGIANVFVDGTLVWTQDGPDLRPLYWAGDPNPLVGTVMDGNCPGEGILDYAYFFNPETPLALEFLAFDANSTEAGNVSLQWETNGEYNAAEFSIERSTDGVNFVEVGRTAPNRLVNAYSYVDVQPGAATYFYRVGQQDAAGMNALSETREVTLLSTNRHPLRAYPNPATGPVSLACDCGDGSTTITLSDASGRTVLQTTGSSAELDLSALPRGLYLVYASNGRAQFHEKLILR